jgi:hypothetical protein
MSSKEVATEYTFLTIYALFSVVNVIAVFKSIRLKELFPSLIMISSQLALSSKLYLTCLNEIT